ncbi:uncharacterized protein LOC130986247 isoform X2 [Salvia miltiorrhiza]|uniref:uncharacterized protein LOC130986247 isoform X2 n=1 Tax=Salvia miltiorrhiza TaxID=226208 RepID=UPI0025ACFF63|nr:uncharacterized protein LOC130986247 isoform X2 [Salvia miltiorrhiza]
MEGVGSRQSRASSRYASGPSAPVFSGRVRKWKKQWVTSPAATITKAGKRNDAPPLLLCRWTPLSAADDPPKRRFRYTPVVPIEKGKTSSVEDEGETGEKTIFSKEEAQEMNAEDQAEED